ncbi:replication protein A 70 kDa DNA-binding subunit B isoform X1 [Spinacia oleracea]|uniref:Replication protein A 70 kDa DNA-binding subunit B isoform X1 n=1 Tax=Spinacia oleracea TaxID=3562 RepID=A0ABM3QJA5_SPIOL|nr:replication protein A 70 kDa DNA-binding subunit B-like isoform X1 [Spinacia oleracea]XP_056683441.1 replication protein A 70 kDa DNA-binding subunit B-like isoform X1 [Spinacia oleracea]XP_056683442.1 replication protein A 70 kDa DNA-binding subunit B-like isoform X1 [Spinacia oleracea]
MLKKEANDVFLVDVIGECTAMSDKIDTSTNGTPNYKVMFELEDLNKNTISGTVWGKYAEQMSEYKKKGIQGRPIIILQFAKIKISRDQVSLCNSLFATKIFINEDISELNDYKESITDGDASRSLGITHLSSQNSHSIGDEFMKMSEHKQLDEIPDTNKECFCATVATIVGFEKDTNWYYNSCKSCNKKVDYEGGGRYWCIKCDSHVKSAPPRYKVTVSVEDDSGSASFVMFDREVFQAIQISTMDLKDKLLKDGKGDSFPEELEMLLERKCLFRIQISKYNLDQDWDKFTVVRLSDDEDLIKRIMMWRLNLLIIRIRLQLRKRRTPHLLYVIMKILLRAEGNNALGPSMHLILSLINAVQY